jgi:hypothetical protein
VEHWNLSFPQDNQISHRRLATAKRHCETAIGTNKREFSSVISPASPATLVESPTSVTGTATKKTPENTTTPTNATTLKTLSYVTPSNPKTNKTTQPQPILTT